MTMTTVGILLWISNQTAGRFAQRGEHPAEGKACSCRGAT